MSVVSFVKITTELKRSKKLHKYKVHEGLKKLPGYEVAMGFGLHIGWAIEGAIGSLLKIDASYLSPDVKLVEKIEVSSKYFGVPIVISGELRNMLSKEADGLFRLLDSVMFVHSKKVLNLFAIDLDLSKIDTDHSQLTLSRKQAKVRRVKNKLNRERYKQQCIAVDSQINALSKFETDADLVIARQPISKEFYIVWEEAL
jgi:hypothetical protein